MPNSKPIGVFDSGVGGLSVLKQLLNKMPNENYIYLGDTARVPYGNKSNSKVIEYSQQAVDFFLEEEVKMIVIACNTASAIAVENIKRQAKGIPIVEMIRPASLASVESTKNYRIGIIGTRATINSKAYNTEILKYDKYSNLKIYSKACPLFVPLVEEAMFDSEATKLIVSGYLGYLKEEDVDTVVLGCTHYPFLKEQIKEVLPSVKLIDTGEEATKLVYNLLKDSNSLNNDNGSISFYLTDTPYMFTDIANKLLGITIDKIKKVDLE
jgi:glutamate racemase